MWGSQDFEERAARNATPHQCSSAKCAGGVTSGDKIAASTSSALCSTARICTTARVSRVAGRARHSRRRRRAPRLERLHGQGHLPLGQWRYLAAHEKF